MRKKYPAEGPTLMVRRAVVAASNIYDESNNSNAMSVNSIAANNSSAKADRRPLVYNRSEKNPAGFSDESRDEVAAAMPLRDMLQGYNDAVGQAKCGEGDRRFGDDEVRDGVAFPTPRMHNHRSSSAFSEIIDHSSLLQPTTASWTSEAEEGTSSALLSSLESTILTKIDVMERSISKLVLSARDNAELEDLERRLTRLEGVFSDLDDEEDDICYSFSLSGPSIACESVSSAPIENKGREGGALTYYERVVHITKKEPDVKIIDITESFTPGGGFAIECKLSEPSEKEDMDVEEYLDEASIETEILHAFVKLCLAAEEEAQTKEAVESNVSETEVHGCNQSYHSERRVLGKNMPASSLFALGKMFRRKRNAANQAEEATCEVSMIAEQEGVKKEEEKPKEMDVDNESMQNSENSDADDESMGEVDLDIEQESNTDGLTVALVRVRSRVY